MWTLHSRNCGAHFHATEAFTGGFLVSVREATSADACGILACLSAAFEVYREKYTAAAFADTVLTLETLHGRFQEMTVFVATENSGEIVGTIACSVINPEEGHIRGMAILPNAQGSGVAARLLAHAEAHYRQRNCKRISLDTTAPLQRAIRFYERSGFSPSGKVQNFFGMPLYEYVKTI
jgi:N-acetylglutamate synthase-like GNAT family acetyltransferase